MWKYVRVTAAIVAMTIVSGCALKPQRAPVPVEAVRSIEGVKWILTGFGDHRIKAPEKAWIELKDGRYVGFAGCNSLSGRYERRGHELRFVREDPHTMIACKDIDKETLFRKRLREVNRYDIHDGMLVMEKGKERVLLFLPASSISMR